jgi:hypothetical protein
VKTQIIQLEPHDDTISVKDKMGWSQIGRVVLVWPARGMVMDRRLDLVLIQRHSQYLGVQIALVTTDPDVRFQAKMLGIPVFRSIRKSQTERWKRTRRLGPGGLQPLSGEERLQRIQSLFSEPIHNKQATRILSQPLRIGIFSIAVIAVLLIAAVLLPSAEIYLTPDNMDQVLTLSVRADDSINEVNLAGELPARWVNVTVEGRGTIPTTGSINIPIGYASGEVLFQNLTDEAVLIPAGTVVSTANSSNRYRTQRDTRVPAGAGEQSSAPIQAITAGSRSNLTSNRIIAVEGDLGLLVSVSNPAPITGGSMAPSNAPNENDRITLKQDLINNLAQTALQEIEKSLEPGDIQLSEKPTLVRIISETYNPDDVIPASELELTLRLDFKAPYVQAEDIEQFANLILDANLPSGYAATPGSNRITQVSEPIFDNGATNSWQVKLQRDLRSVPSHEAAINLSLGKKPEQAQQLLLDNLDISGIPRIYTSPAWWPIIPFVPIRIDVITPANTQVSNTTRSEGIE